MRVRRVYSKREGHELSGVIEALVEVVWAIQWSRQHFYVFLRCEDVSLKWNYEWWTSGLGEGLAATRTLRFSPKGAFSYSTGIENRSGGVTAWFVNEKRFGWV